MGNFPPASAALPLSAKHYVAPAPVVVVVQALAGESLATLTLSVMVPVVPEGRVLGDLL